MQGPSGCGKTTLLLIVGALQTPDAGTVAIDGRDIYALPQERRAAFRAATIGFVFQQFHLVPYLTVRENILLPTLVRDSAEIRARADALVAQFGLAHRVTHVPAELSIGERQRVALARALLRQPALILADEPTGNLDAENATVVVRALQQYAAEGKCVLMVTHNAEAARAAQRVVHMAGGCIQ